MKWLHDLSTPNGKPWNGAALVWTVQHRDHDFIYTTASDRVDAATAGGDGAHRLLHRQILRKLAAYALDVHPDRIELGRRPSGAPCVSAPLAMFASCAGRMDWHAVAIARQPIGVDIETLPPPKSLPIDLLPRDERSALAGLHDTSKAIAFLKVWTAREAYMKASGLDLEESFATVSARILGTGVIKVAAVGKRAAAVEVVESQSYIAAAVEL